MHSSQWFMRRRFQRFVNISPLLPLKWPLSLNKSESPFPRNTSYQVEIRPVVLEKKSFKGKVDVIWMDGRTLRHAISSLAL